MARTAKKTAKGKRTKNATIQDLPAKKPQAVKVGALAAYLSIPGTKQGDIKGS